MSLFRILPILLSEIEVDVVNHVLAKEPFHQDVLPLERGFHDRRLLATCFFFSVLHAQRRLPHFLHPARLSANTCDVPWQFHGSSMTVFFSLHHGHFIMDH